jgi:hypothetical protein
VRFVFFAKENLYPKITGTLALKWDISKAGKIFMWTTDGPSGVTDLELATKVAGADAEVRTLDEIHRSNDSCVL